MIFLVGFLLGFLFAYWLPFYLHKRCAIKASDVSEPGEPPEETQASKLLLNVSHTKEEDQRRREFGGKLNIEGWLLVSLEEPRDLSQPHGIPWSGGGDWLWNWRPNTSSQRRHEQKGSLDDFRSQQDTASSERYAELENRVLPNPNIKYCRLDAEWGQLKIYNNAQSEWPDESIQLTQAIVDFYPTDSQDFEYYLKAYPIRIRVPRSQRINPALSSSRDVLEIADTESLNMNAVHTYYLYTCRNTDKEDWFLALFQLSMDRGRLSKGWSVASNSKESATKMESGCTSWSVWPSVEKHLARGSEQTHDGSDRNIADSLPANTTLKKNNSSFLLEGTRSQRQSQFFGGQKPGVFDPHHPESGAWLSTLFLRMGTPLLLQKFGNRLKFIIDWKLKRSKWDSNVQCVSVVVRDMPLMEGWALKPHLDNHEDMWWENMLCWEQGLEITLCWTMDIPLVGKVPITISFSISQLKGKLWIRYKSAPSNRFWISFPVAPTFSFQFLGQETGLPVVQSNTQRASQSMPTTPLLSPRESSNRPSLAKRFSVFQSVKPSRPGTPDNTANIPNESNPRNSWLSTPIIYLQKTIEAYIRKGMEESLVYPCEEDFAMGEAWMDMDWQEFQAVYQRWKGAAKSSS